MKINYSLYLVTDKGLAGKRPVVSIVEKAIKGGVTIVQYREKNAPTGEMIEEAQNIHNVTLKAGIPLIIDDRTDVALAVGAEGVHIGQSDMPADLVRKTIGLKKILGVTAGSVKEAVKAEKDGADYLGISDIFGSSTKTDTGGAVGVEMIRQIRKAVRIPIVGIGGITLENAGWVIAAGADGIAVISAIFSAKKPEVAAKNLRSVADHFKEIN